MITEKMLKDDLGEEFQSITIGPGGENKVIYSCISHDFGRQAGRTGVGAVLGGKNIKAVSIKGTGGIPVYDVQGLYKKGKECFADIRKKPGFTGWTPEGTAGITDWCNETGSFPTKNFQTSYCEHYKDINGKAIIDRLKITDKGCFCCPTPCGKYGYTKTALGSAYVEGPEYETIALIGGNCYLKTIEDVGYANYVSDELGLDTISAGLAVSFTIECYEKGILTKEDIGMDVKFGDLETVVYLMEKISKREGIGNLLAEGVKKASEKIGQGTEKFAIHVKGLEWTGYECRNAPGMMLAYMTADIGAHHSKAWVLGHDVAGTADNVHDLISAGAESDKRTKSPKEGKAEIVIDSQHTRPSFDLLGICRLQFMELGFEVEHYEELFYLITGRKITWDEILKVSERVWNLNRCISNREIEDFGRSYDYPPARFYEDPVPTGPNKGFLIPKDEMDYLLDDYYKLRGWNKNGIPEKEKLIDLGLKEVVENL
jgi:aldehyde:ferredoxin oxidoreductase